MSSEHWAYKRWTNLMTISVAPYSRYTKGNISFKARSIWSIFRNNNNNFLLLIYLYIQLTSESKLQCLPRPKCHSHILNIASLRRQTIIITIQPYVMQLHSNSLNDSKSSSSSGRWFPFFIYLCLKLKSIVSYEIEKETLKVWLASTWALFI